MNALEANALLTQAALLDSRMRRVDPVERADQATAWATVLVEIPFEQALAAVTAHYQASREVLMPADIVAACGDPWSDYPVPAIDTTVPALGGAS